MITCQKSQMTMDRKGMAQRASCALPFKHKGRHEFRYKDGALAWHQRAWYGLWFKIVIVKGD